MPKDETIPKVDDYIHTEMQIPGLALAVIKDGQIVIAKGYGLANVEHQVPVKPETIFQSGSTGKQFTATAVMMLVEEGKLSLEDKITKYFPDGPEAWGNITVRHLLTHTSGMTDYPRDLWALSEVRGRRIIEHGGAWQGFKAHISRYVDDKMTVILFANQIRANQTKLARGVAAIINPELASKN